MVNRVATPVVSIGFVLLVGVVVVVSIAVVSAGFEAEDEAPSGFT